MGFQSQEPIFVRRAREVAGLHMAFQFGWMQHKDIWCVGPPPQPLSVQSPEPTDQDWYGRQITAVCVTLRYPERWQVRVYLERTGDGRECWQWKVLRLDSLFYNPSKGEMEELTSEGQTLLTRLVESYGMSPDDLSCTFVRKASNLPMDDLRTRFGDRRTDAHWYCMANGQKAMLPVIYDRVDGRMRRRIHLPACLGDLKIYEAA